MSINRFKRVLRDFVRDESGLAAAELAMLMAFVMIPIIIAIFTFLPDIILFIERNPYLKTASVAVILIGAFFGVITWCVKRIVLATDKTAVVQIAELLSASDGMTREELNNILKKRDFTYRILPTLLNNTLANLFSSGKIKLKDGKYILVANEEEAPKN